MGSTIWLLSESTLEQGDTWDHSAMLVVLEQLDLLCSSLNVPTISSFVGLTEYSGNRSWKTIRKRASWFDARTAIPTFQALRAYFIENPDALLNSKNALAVSDFRQNLLDELGDCLDKVTKFAEQGDPFHVSFVS
jgi:predicted RNA-binding protein with EMAP domain